MFKGVIDMGNPTKLGVAFNEKDSVEEAYQQINKLFSTPFGIKLANKKEGINYIKQYIKYNYNIGDFGLTKQEKRQKQNREQIEIQRLRVE